MKSKKTGLVLEGGGMRGIYTAGVLDVFLDEKLCFDGVIGVSAGAIHGASFLSAQRGRSLRYTEKYCNDPRFMSFRSLIKTGNIVGADFCYHELPERLEPYDFDAFNACGTEFFAGVTCVLTGKAEYLRITDMLGQIDYIRASSSLPFVSRTVWLFEKPYLDGCCADSIPVQGFMDMGYEKCVVILTKPQRYRCKPEPRLLTNVVFRKYPEFRKVLLDRHNAYNKTVERIEQMEKEGKIFVIRPSKPTPAGKIEHDPAKIRETYDLGAKDAAEKMNDLKAWLGRV